MHKTLIALLLFLPFSVTADQYIFRDSECKTMGTVLSSSPIIKNGSKNEILCITSDKEAMCNYKAITTGKSESEPTKYQISTIGQYSVWENNEDNNIKIVINTQSGDYISNVMALYIENGLILSKQCSGKIIQHTGD